MGFLSLIEPNPKDENAKEEFVPAAVLQELKAQCVEKIESALAAGRSPADLLGILYRWRTGPGPTARQNTASVSSKAMTVFEVSRSVTVCARSHGITDHVVSQHWYIRRRDVEAFLPFDAIESRVNSLAAGVALSTEDERALKAFKEAAERRRAGKSDEDPFRMMREEFNS